MHRLAQLSRYAPIMKYLVSGAVAAAVNIGGLTVLVEYARFNYVSAEVAAFVLSFFVNFFLQRTWTFNHSREAGVSQQIGWYLLLALANLAGNVSLLYFFVHTLHIWYPLAEAGAILLLAGISFFICRYFIFISPARRVKFFLWVRAHTGVILAATAMALALFLSTYKLTESPPTWFDEGIITQVAMNNASHGLHAELQVAPGHYESAAYTGTTSYPVTFPIAAAFRLFGAKLLVARVVMVFFILGFVWCAWLFMRKKGMPVLAAIALWLLVTFPPLYGDGKNVLGEIPGLLYLTVFLLWVQRIELRKTNSLDFFGAAALLGFIVATKPIFFLLLPPVGIVFLCSSSLLTVRKTIAALIGFSIPMSLWVWVQFGGQTFSQVFAFYANPYGVNISSSIAANLMSFVHEPEPFYALLLLLVWAGSFIVRIRAGERIPRAEYIAGGFALLVYTAYLRATGDYRYFLLGEVLALLYFPFNLARLWPLLSLKTRTVPRFLMYGLFGFLVLFQFYECFAHSWVAIHYNSHRTATLTAKLGSLPPSTSIFIYQAPELPLFLPYGMPYYQYFVATQSVSIGEAEVPLIAKRVPEFIVLPQNLAPRPEPDLTGYREIETFDRYGLWKRM